MPNENGRAETRVLSKVAKVLEDLPTEERRLVLEFLAQEPRDAMQVRAEAARRVASLLEGYEERARRRCLAFFADQLGGDEQPEAQHA